MIDLRQDEAREYRRAARRRGRFATAASLTVLVLAALAAGWVDDRLPGPAPLRAALLVLIVGVVHEAVQLPFGLAGFRASKAAGLSVQSTSGWLADRAKAWAIAAVLGLPAVALLVLAQRSYPDGWPYLAWGASLLLSLVLSVVAPVLLLPLFLRSEPLAPGALRTMAEELVARSGLHVSDIRLLLMSEKTTSANAAVVGLGPTRRILLGDTLTGDEADDGRLAESRAVLAHELAHHAHGDMWRGLALEAGSVAPGLDAGRRAAGAATDGARARRRRRPGLAAGVRAVVRHRLAAARPRHRVALAPARAGGRCVRLPAGRRRVVRPRPGAAGGVEPGRAGARRG